MINRKCLLSPLDKWFMFFINLHCVLSACIPLCSYLLQAPAPHAVPQPPAVIAFNNKQTICPVILDFMGTVLTILPSHCIVKALIQSLGRLVMTKWCSLLQFMVPMVVWLCEETESLS